MTYINNNKEEKKKRGPSERKSFKIGLFRVFPRYIKRQLKDAYMLELFESKHGGLDNLKRHNQAFDIAFVKTKMIFIIWLVMLGMAIASFLYMRYNGVSLWLSIPISLLFLVLLKKVLEKMAKALLEIMRR